MTVKQLIKELKKMPQNADVYTCDHDHSEWMTNSMVLSIDLVDQSELSKYAKEQLEKEPLFKIKDKYVTIRV